MGYNHECRKWEARMDDNEYWYGLRIILKSKTQRDSLRAAFVATRFLTRLPANVKGTRKLALKQEMYRLLERCMDLMKKKPTSNTALVNPIHLRVVVSSTKEPRLFQTLMY